MTDQQIQEIADRVVAALEGLAPGTNWLAVLLPPFAVLAAALTAFLLGRKTLDQKSEADARSEWWRRTQWALEATASDTDEKLYAYGTEMLQVLARSKLAGEEELDLLDAVWEESSTEMRDDEIVELLEVSREFVSPDEQMTLTDYLREKAMAEAFDEVSVDDEADSGENDVKEESK